MTQHTTTRHLTKVVFPILFAAIVLISCGKDQIDMFDCVGFQPTYTADVKPILDNTCGKSGCHNAASAMAGIVLTNYASASSASKSDRFLGSIQHKRGFEPMPEDAPKLSNDLVEMLTCWVQGGSPE
jgi:hypothetical protein